MSSDGNNMKHVINVIKTFFHGISYDEMSDNLDTLWSEYYDYNKNNCHFDGDDIIFKIIILKKVISIFGIRNIHYHEQR